MEAAINKCPDCGEVKTLDHMINMIFMCEQCYNKR